MNSYWMFWIGRVRGARSASSICDFWKMTFRDLTAFFSFLLRENVVFFQIFLLRSIKAYLCANINFDSVDFSGRRPEEVISFFWRSVYKHFKPNSYNLFIINIILRNLLMIVYCFIFINSLFHQRPFLPLMLIKMQGPQPTGPLSWLCRE